MKHSFHNRVALVTGAGSGLGYQHACTLALLGAKVLIQDLRSEHGGSPEEKTAREVAEELQRAGFEDVDHDQGNIGEEHYSRGLVERTVRRFGRIDIVINNAGKPAPGTALDTETSVILDSLQVNLLGAFWITRAALRFMRDQNYGRIVNTASGTAAFGSANMLSYVAAKGGLIAVTKATALENLDRNIKINTLCPVAYTVMAREYFGSRKDLDLSSLDPAFVTPIALYLAHDECPFTGETLSAGAGKWSRIITAKSEGPAKISKHVDDAFEWIDQVMDDSRFSVLRNAQAQYDRKA